MLDLGRHDVLGVGVNAADYQHAVQRIIEAARVRAPLTVSALAVHGVMTGVLDPVHRYRLNSIDLVLPDGQPVRWALSWLHRVRLPDRVYGPRLMLELCRRAASEGLPIFLFGGTEQKLERLRRQLDRRVPGLLIAGHERSRFRRLSAEEKDSLARRIRDSGAALTLVGIGCPRQEVWVYEQRDALSMPLVAVGAAFDFLAGSQPQAPPGLQRLGLEWAFRLLQEPRRLWRRYLLLNPLYVAALWAQRCGLWQRRSMEAPDHELRHG